MKTHKISSTVTFYYIGKAAGKKYFLSQGFTVFSGSYLKKDNTLAHYSNSEKVWITEPYI